MTAAVTVAQSGAPGVSLGFKNRIINGGMTIDQRNSGASITVDNTAVYSLDRWIVEDGSSAVFTAQQVSDAPAGFVNSLKLTATTATGSVGASQYDAITQWVEGNNIADLGFGSADAKTITVSFWVKATVTGQYSCTIVNSGASRINPQAYTVNASNTWEYKTVTFTGDTTGTWLKTNGRGVSVNFYPVLGSNFLGSAGWNGSLIFGVTGQANAFATIGNVFQVTGVQLEKGTAATQFEFRDYGRELNMCFRYYQRWDNKSASGATALGPNTSYNGSTNFTSLTFKQEMRTVPTYVYSATADISIYGNGSGYTPSSVSQGIEVGTGNGEIQIGISGLAAGLAGFARVNTGATKYFACNAEL